MWLRNPAKHEDTKKADSKNYDDKGHIVKLLVSLLGDGIVL